MGKKKNGKHGQNGRHGQRRATIGIDIGGTKSLYALFDANFEVLAEEKLRTRPDKGGLPAFRKEMKDAVRKLLEEARRRDLRLEALGVGCAGEIDMKRGVIVRSPNLSFLDGYPLRERLEKLVGCPVFIGHDVQAALYGEYMLGAAKKARDAIGIWIGTGVGGAMILDGRLHLGVSGRAGDIGNYLVHAIDTSADAPRKTVLDNVASRSAIAGEAAALAVKRVAPKLHEIAGTDVGEIGSGDIARAIKGGDKALEKLVRSRIAVVGTVASNLVDFLNPDMVVLGGGLVCAMPQLVRREVRRAIEAHASPKSAKAARVATARFGDHAGTVGAARLALDMQSAFPPISV